MNNLSSKKGECKINFRENLEICPIHTNQLYGFFLLLSKNILRSSNMQNVDFSGHIQFNAMNLYVVATIIAYNNNDVLRAYL